MLVRCKNLYCSSKLSCNERCSKKQQMKRSLIKTIYLILARTKLNLQWKRKRERLLQTWKWNLWGQYSKIRTRINLIWELYLASIHFHNRRPSSISTSKVSHVTVNCIHWWAKKKCNHLILVWSDIANRDKAKIISKKSWVFRIQTLNGFLPVFQSYCVLRAIRLPFTKIRPGLTQTNFMVVLMGSCLM